MKSSILEKLKSNNKNLDGLVKKNFIIDAKLDIPEVGKYFFKDINNDFEYALLEYSITYSKVINNYKSRPSNELLKLNDIPTESYELLVEKVNEILKSHTDEALSVTLKRQILENQIIEFTGHYPDEETRDKMFQSLLVSEDNTKKNNYLDSVISAMQKAEVNQMEDNKYMVLKYIILTIIKNHLIPDCMFTVIVFCIIIESIKFTSNSYFITADWYTPFTIYYLIIPHNSI